MVDPSVKKQVTAVVLDSGDGTHEQVTPPQFLDYQAKDKLFRVTIAVEGINNRLAELRQQGKAHIDRSRFDHLPSEYRQTRQKDRQLREQISHDVMNQLVFLTVENECETTIFESLGKIKSPDTAGARGQEHFLLLQALVTHVVDGCIDYEVGRIAIGDGELSEIHEDENSDSRNWDKCGDKKFNGWELDRLTTLFEYKPEEQASS